ncbi:MAG: S8 family serine peptidase [Candidatus Riflebacteria bacterium]|nr:S8 family serine peptidase [Candidatus Riflebacteria bacterium]
MIFKGKIRLLTLASAFFATCCWGLHVPEDRWIVQFKADRGNVVREYAKPSELIRVLQSELNNNLQNASLDERSEGMVKLWAARAVAINANHEQIEAIKKLENVSGVHKVVPIKYNLQKPRSDNTEVSREFPSWGVVHVRAPEVWEKFKIDGSGILVGHVDTGAAGSHELFAGKILKFWDLNPNDGSVASPVDGSKATDENMHGSHTAGTICAGGNIGVAPGARLMVAKVFDGMEMSTHEIFLRAYQWMLDPDGNPDTNDFPRIVSVSLGGKSYGGTDSDENLYYDVVNNWVAAGILPVFAAGNGGPMPQKIDYCACFLQSWAVGGLKSNNSIALFSSPGPATWNGVTYIKPDICAPGKDIISVRPNGGTYKMDGTSAATPHAAGVAALVLQANPTLKPAEVRDLIESCALDLGSSGKDNRYGAGLIDAYKSVEKAIKQASAENVVDGYRRALETESALGTTVNSPLAAPMASYLLEKANALDSGEMISLENEYRNDENVRKILKNADSMRKFNQYQN